MSVDAPSNPPIFNAGQLKTPIGGIQQGVKVG
jgi:hypothetical protein